MPPTPEKPDKVEAQTEPPGFVPAIILRNKGVPITLYRLENGELPAIEEGDELPTRTLYLKFTANHVADIEEAFDGMEVEVPVVERTVRIDSATGKPLEGPAGVVYDEKVVGRELRRFYGLEAFQQALGTYQTKTVRRVIAICLGWTVEQAGIAMIADKTLDYSNAVGVAWSIAQGVDPTDAAKTLAQANGAVAAARARLGSELEKTMAEVST